MINLAPFIVFIAGITLWVFCFLCVAIYDHIECVPAINLEQDAIDSGMSETLNEGEVT